MTNLKPRLSSWKLVNTQGNYVILTNYGARITGIFVPDIYGNMESVVLGFDNISDYLNDTCYLGATIGPVANRISDGRYNLSGRQWFTDKNDGENTNHSGFRGFDKMIFDCQYCDSQRITFTLNVNLLGSGFPGNISLWVSYSFSDDNTLSIDYKAISDSQTILNITNHAYFNLSANKAGIGSEHLYINSEYILESNRQYIPTGRILPTAQSRYDFKKMRLISQHGLGYNEYYILSPTNIGQPSAIVYSPLTGRKMDVRTSYPGLFLYTGDYLSSEGRGWNGGRYKVHDGLCLEAQLYPNAVNCHNFPSVELNPIQEYNHFISLSFYAG